MLNAQLAKTWILSYRAQMKKSQITHEHFHITPAMTNIKGVKGESITLDVDEKLSNEENLNNNKEKILEFLFKNKIHLQSHSDNTNNINKSITTLSVEPVPILVEFNSNIVSISILNREKQ